MSALSDYAENLLLDWLMTTGTATRPTAWYLALFTSSPGDDASGSEVSGNAYAREAVTFDAASGGSTANDGLITFGPASGGNWGTITHFGIFDAATNGNLLWHGALSASRVVNDGDSIQVPVGNLTLTLA